MNVFLAWSGEASKAAATALREWLPMVLQRVQPFMSEEDIQKGARWRQDITKQLSSTSFAILCLTKDNLESRWMHFEAGAIATRSEANRVTALLLGIEHKDVVAPLSDFQHTMLARDDVLKLVRDINGLFGTDAVDDVRLEKTFGRFWGDLESQLQAAMSKAGPKAVRRRQPEELLPEILEYTRSQGAALQKILVSLERLATARGRPFFPENSLGFTSVNNPGLLADQKQPNLWPNEAGSRPGDYFGSNYFARGRSVTIPELLERKFFEFLQSEAAKSQPSDAATSPSPNDQLRTSPEARSEKPPKP